MTTEVNIPGEARQAAMRAMSEVATSRGYRLRDERGPLAEAAITAAAPYILAAELERIAEGLRTSCRVDDPIGTAAAAARNGVRNELLARASELRGEDEPCPTRGYPKILGEEQAWTK